MKELIKEYIMQCLLFQTDYWPYRVIGVISWLCFSALAVVSYCLVSHLLPK
jgi:hypothetical protein